MQKIRARCGSIGGKGGTGISKRRKWRQVKDAGSIGGKRGIGASKRRKRRQVRRAGSIGGQGGTGQSKRRKRHHVMRAGLIGGQGGTGHSKQRIGSRNGRSRLDPLDYHTWRPLTVAFPAFQYLLMKLHDCAAMDPDRTLRPYLRVGALPKWLQSSDLPTAVACMNATRFCNPDRFKDFVSIEILTAFASEPDLIRKIAIAIVVRYKQSPRGLAPALVGKDQNSFVATAKNGRTAAKHTDRRES